MLSDRLKPLYHNSKCSFFSIIDQPLLNLHSLSKLIHIFLIRQGPGSRVIKIQIGLPSLSIPLFFTFKVALTGVGG